ncbi:MAG: hypothetical protein ABFS09_00315 [Thermodesulfobacteriota bacterium]
MKWLVVLLLVLGWSGAAYADDEAKIIRMKGQNYKIWTDKNGIRHIDPIYLVEKSAGAKAADKKEAVAASKAKEKEKAVKPEKVKEPDPAVTVVEEMTYDACRESLAAAEAMASVYNVVFDYPKGQKFTVLMVVDEKTVQLKCEYGTRVATTWDK